MYCMVLLMPFYRATRYILLEVHPEAYGVGFESKPGRLKKKNNIGEYDI